MGEEQIGFARFFTDSMAYEIILRMEVKHFFSGAALYVNATICASWSPVGLAFKLPDREVASLISNGGAKPLQYFPKPILAIERKLFGAIKTG